MTGPEGRQRPTLADRNTEASNLAAQFVDSVPPSNWLSFVQDTPMLNETYWAIVARGIDVEDEKMDLFVRHNHSRGIAREAILRSLMIAQTPEPYVVRTGFVYNQDSTNPPPKQCDVLVYDPRISQPYYRLDEFVVVPPQAARVVVEVKSDLNQVEFEKVTAMRRTIRPVLGFAYEGPTFKTFCEYLSGMAERVKTLSGMAERVKTLYLTPEAIAVHRQNYLGIRSNQFRDSVNNEAYLAIQFPSQSPGLATSHFLDAYMKLLTTERISDGELHSWFNELQLPQGSKALILPDGTITEGPAIE